jgi:hypothetical protein
MHLINYLQYIVYLLFSELEVQFYLYVDERIFWIYHPNLLSTILNGTCNLHLMRENDPR